MIRIRGFSNTGSGPDQNTATLVFTFFWAGRRGWKEVGSPVLSPDVYHGRVSKIDILVPILERLLS